MALLFDPGIFSVIGLASELLVGAKLYWYTTGTSTPLATYSDQALTVPNANPVVANADGRFPAIWLQEASYKLVLKSALDVTLVTRDPIIGTTALATLAAPTGSSLVGYTQAGTGAVPRTVQAAVRDLNVSVVDFGASGDGSTPNLTAFMNAEACIRARSNSSTSYNAGLKLHIPGGGRYLMEGTWDIKLETLNIVGDGVGFAVTGASTLMWQDPAVDGIRIQSADTTGSGVQSPPTKSGGGFTMRGVTLLGPGKGVGTGRAIWARAPFEISDYIIGLWGSHGIYSNASVGGGGSLRGNTNLSRVYGGQIVSCGGDGLHGENGDSNAWIVMGLNSMSNGGWGVYANNFLGSTFIGCHTSGNTGGGYTAINPNARNVFLGCYSEPDQPTNVIAPPSIMIEGEQGAGVSGAYLTADQQARLFNMFGFSGGRTVAGAIIAQGISVDTTGEIYGGLEHSVRLPGGPIAPQWNGFDLFETYAGILGNAAHGRSGPLTTRTFGASAARPHIFIAPQGLSLGGGTTGIQLPDIDQIPVAGDYAAGDWAKFTPSSSFFATYFGAECQVAGNPGTWKKFGAKV